MTTLNSCWQVSADGRSSALVFPGGPANEPHANAWCISRSQLEDHVYRLFNFLSTTYRVGRGDAVATSFENGVSAVLSFFAVTGMGAVCAPLNPAYRKAAISFYLSDTKPKLLLMPTPLSPTQRECYATALDAGVSVAFLDADLDGQTLRVNGTSLNVVTVAGAHTFPSATDVALVLHTSGTTSKPKGVPLTHGNVMASVGNIAQHYRLASTDVSLVVMPLFHVHGLIGCLLSTLASGGTCVVPTGKFSASAFWKTMCHFNCTWFSAVPTIHQILLKNVQRDYFVGLSDAERAQLSARWRFMRSCSAPLPAAVLGKLEKTYSKPVLEAYAMTEASHQMCANPLPELGPHKPGSVGCASGVHLLILDNDRAVPLRQGQVGEVAVSGPSVTAGYLNRPDANASSFETVKGDRFFRTGDQGRLDADGYLFLTGRLKEMINRGGEKIAPQEVDDCLLRHPDLSLAVAFAVPDKLLGEVVGAAVVPARKGGDAEALENSVRRHCAEQLPPFMCPVHVFLADDVPRTATGKVQRRFVAEHFLKSSSKL